MTGRLCSTIVSLSPPNEALGESAATAIEGYVRVSDLQLSVPLQGWLAPLAETPDPVFAQAMLGDGLAIDPTAATLFAPCDGLVSSVHRARHAVSLTAANGAEILMHIGLETVAMGGEGFEPHVAVGDRVSAGDPLMGFDLDLIARRAHSLITPIVITNSAEFEIVSRRQDRLARVGEPMMTVRRRAADATAESVTPEGEAIRRSIIVPLVHGLHARPAARIVDAIKGFEAEVSIVKDDRTAKASSAVSIMALAVRDGDRITVSGSGPDAEAAVAAVCALIESGMGERSPPADVSPQKSAPGAEPRSVKETTPVLAISELGAPDHRGVGAAPGLAIGSIVHLTESDIEIAEDGEDETAECAALADALDQVRSRLAMAAAVASARGDVARHGVLTAHGALLDDPELAESALALIAQGRGAGAAWRAAIRSQADVLLNSGDRRMAERAADLTDLERQVLRVLTGAPLEDRVLSAGSVILADELLPSQLMAFDAAKLSAVCMARGGPTSHVAILAAALGLPMIVAAGSDLLGAPEGATVIVDADQGAIWIRPSAAALAVAQTQLAERRARRAEALAMAHHDCRTADGTRIEVFANVGSIDEASKAVLGGAEGSGLLRTEFLFLDRDTPPDEEEQLSQYQGVSDALEGRPLIIRTLDVGGDKAAAYLPIDAEENPALGLRGVRVSLWRPELLRTQLRAILRVRPEGRCKIMVPMIADLEELRAVRRLLDEEIADLGFTGAVELGVMVETPAAAISADILASEADFLSIGTNDLTQYVLAMDRGNPRLAGRIDALHPAVLRMISQTCQGGARHGRWVGVCGGLASELLAAPILIGLGVRELSATVAMVAELKARVRTLNLADCRALADRALYQTSPDAVRALATAFLAGA